MSRTLGKCMDRWSHGLGAMTKRKWKRLRGSERHGSNSQNKAEPYSLKRIKDIKARAARSRLSSPANFAEEHQQMYDKR